ncbi:hypothetical protein EDF24_1003 [Curtobacterium sp. PhB130]|uniref:hypothetical protein n=1 Tax=unclassified Curtobacterium TaxID=257496 RepID=UPI000F4CB0D5|nr:MULTISPECIES: hypothetical protein [unclassified Curtobacterium]ROP65187.1 hypothetical protein EDF55_1842 [Curtobacterium sp. ZW137]ROS78231.1 hypothetical protein EDF24_1003 [Curtobacterium sp. PhB130]TCK65450.1 hypothetical protein EDF27_0189 [Curtobacterium sp. PhB136]
MANDSLPELELANVRTRERITDTVERIRQKVDVPARTRLAVAKTKQRWHRDPTPLVALAATAAAGIAAIVVGVRIRHSPGARLDALRTPAPVPVFKPVKVGKDGKSKGVPAFSRKDDKHNPVLQDQQAAAKRRKKVQKQAKKAGKQAAKRARRI